MGSEGTARGIAWRLAALAGSWITLERLWSRPESVVLAALVALMTVGLAVSLVRFVGRGERDLARFIDAVGHGDLTQRFGGDRVGDALDAAMRRLHGDRQRAGEDARVQAALIERSPTPLLTVEEDGAVRLVNESARTLLTGRDGRHVTDFTDLGEAFAAVLAPTAPLGRSLVPFATSIGARPAVVTATVLARSGQTIRLVSVEPIGRELASAEVAAQADLVRVLTHEIMNSMTPITSLARSATMLMDKVTSDDPAILDARRAIGIVAERSAGLLGFVSSYRQYATLPVVQPRVFAATPWLRSMADLNARSGPAPSIMIDVETVPEDLLLDADPDLLAQAVLNLLKNAGEAGARHVLLTARALPEEVEIIVADDGSGIPKNVAADIFLPFFTSKATGTGIGLSLSRQVAVAHGGTIATGTSILGGAMFRLALPRTTDTLRS